MAGHGPPPDLHHRRRNVVKVLRLPARGREGRTPKWPIPLAQGESGAETKQLRRLEAEIWAQLWKTPQAAAWEQFGYFREVAQYVRWKVLGELGGLKAAQEARMMSDRLGLTPMALKHLAWEIDADEVGEKREQRVSSTRTRLRAVDSAVAIG